MKFTKISINNFRQYYGTVDIDLSTNESENIVLIGGQNGFGKTNLHTSFLWCLFGDNYYKAKNNFKEEDKRTQKHTSYIGASLNWEAKRQHKTKFSVSLTVSNIDIPKFDQYTYSDEITITRTYDIKSGEKKFSIIDSKSGKIIINNEEDGVRFIYDFIIPIDAAKFVFFDAEEISDIADLSDKDEGNYINDAIGKILGLDIYSTLIEDLKEKIKTLQKEGANKNIQVQCAEKEKTLKLKEFELEENTSRINELQRKIENLENKIKKYDNFISKRGKENGNPKYNREALTISIQELSEKKEKINDDFSSLSEVIPLAILTGKLIEVETHLDRQKQYEKTRNERNEIFQKIDSFIEQLLNQPPEPEDSKLSFKAKNFYYNKAKDLSTQIFNSDQVNELSYEYDLKKSEEDLVRDALYDVNTQKIDHFKNIIEDLDRIQIDLDQKVRQLNKIDEDSEDKAIEEYIIQKESAIQNQKKYIEEKGALSHENEAIERVLARLQREIQSIYSKIELNNIIKQKIQVCEKYIDVLTQFIEEEKRAHMLNIKRNILRELKLLMHKLSGEINKNKFIDHVDVLLSPTKGMNITLSDSNRIEIKKKSLSSGEKQIYISCLIKAILQESIQKLPIFIDTPLGRLDEAHRDTIISRYYPALSEQVVLFSTDSEITPSRYDSIKHKISKSYLLVNDGTNTHVKEGYFKTNNND